MTRWVTVDMQQSRPFETGVLDTGGRVVFSFNAIVTRHPTATFEEEAAKILVNAGIGALNATIFVGSMAVIPNDSGPYLSVLAAVAAPPVNTHNVAGVSYEQAGLQIIVRGKLYVPARDMAFAAHAALAAVHNLDVAA